MKKTKRIEFLADNVNELRSIFEEYCRDDAKRVRKNQRTLNWLRLQIEVLKQMIEELQREGDQ